MVFFGMATQRVAVGGAPVSPEDIKDAYAAGVRGILNVREVDDMPLIEAAGLRSNISYLHLHEPDDRQPKKASWFESGIEFAREVMWYSGGAVLVHCDAGIDRSPSMAYAILVACFGLGSSCAWELVENARPQAAVTYRDDADRAMAEIGFPP